MRLCSCAFAALLLLLAGCAEKPTAPDDLADYTERNDPLEPANRKFFAVNTAIDHAAVRPVAGAYRDHVPDAIRSHLHNTLTNLGNPAQLANDMLQGRPRKAGNTLVRLLVNTTLGIGGVFDVASGWGYPDHDTDFGLTLALWGVPDGPFLFLPILGPSDPRDAIGFGANSALDPLTWVSFGGSATLGWSRFGLGAIDTRSRLLEQTDAIEQTALDPYATYRSLYQQHRKAEIESGQKDLPATIPQWYPAAAEVPAQVDRTPKLVAPGLGATPALKP